MPFIDGFPDSPRISFSQDLHQNDAVPVRSSSPSSADFDFCVFRESHDLDSSSADELFSDGKILPVEIKKRTSPQQKPPPAPTRGIDSLPPSELGVDKASCKAASFWPFKRSTSLNCGSGYARMLSRSNSTGSTSGVNKRSPASGSQHHNKLGKFSSTKLLPPPPSFSRPPLKKNSHGGIKVNPVLNVPPANLFGLGSIFSGGKKK